MALTTLPRPVLVSNPGGRTSSIAAHGREKASQTWKKGAFLIDDDSGRLTESTSPIDGSAVAKRTLGLAEGDATGTTDADVRMADLVGGDLILEITLSDSTAGTTTLAQSHLHKVYPITKAAGGTTWYLDANAVSDTGGGYVIGFKDPIGTVDARVFCKVTQTAIGGANAGSGNV